MNNLNANLNLNNNNFLNTNNLNDVNNFGGVDTGLGSNTNAGLTLNNNNNNPFVGQNTVSEQLVLQESRQQVSAQSHSSKPVKQEVSCTVILPLPK